MTENKLTPEQTALIEDNIELAYWHAHQWARRYDCLTTDEFISSALFGLTKAAIAFDDTRGTQFNTYARFVIENGFKNEMKKERRCFVGIRESDFDEAGAENDQDAGMDLMNSIDGLPPLYKEILLEFYQEGLFQHEIAEKHNISQAKTSLILKKSRKRIAEDLNL